MKLEYSLYILNSTTVMPENISMGGSQIVRITKQDDDLTLAAMLTAAMIDRNTSAEKMVYIGENTHEHGAAILAGCDFIPAEIFFEELNGKP